MTSQDAKMDVVPVPAAEVESEIVDTEVMLYHPAQTRAIYLNATAALVWGLCDGRRSAREIVRLIGEGYPEAGDALAEQVLTTLNHLKENGVLVID